MKENISLIEQTDFLMQLKKSLEEISLLLVAVKCGTCLLRFLIIEFSFFILIWTSSDEKV